MGGGHGPPLPEIPDWRIYRVEDVPELVKLQKALAHHGLSDPWLRNEVWKFKEVRRINNFGYFFGLLTGGFKYGAMAAAVTIGIQFLATNLLGEKKDHH